MDASVWIAVIPSAVSGFFFWLVERRITKREETEKEERLKRQEEQDKRDDARRKNELYLMKAIDAAVTLSEATARAVQRIPDAKCNGDMHAALDYSTRVRSEYEDFLNKEAINKLY